MRKVLLAILAICCLLPLVTAGFPTRAASELDTETFLSTNFDLQESYSRVLCVQQGTACPVTIETAVPCLTDGCVTTPQSYNVHSTYTTLQAASDAALPGDLIIIMPGTYAGVSVEEKHGANNAYIHFLGWGEPGSVIVNAPTEAGIRHHFYFINTRYYIIQNIAFQDSAEGAGLFFSGYFSATGEFSHHLIVMDVYSHDNYKWGLHTTQASYMVIQDSIFTGSEDEHGAYISGGGDHFLIRRNVFQGNNASGLQVNADPQTATAELFYYLDNTTGDTCGWTEADVDFTGSATWHDLKACYDSQGLPDLGDFIDDGISKDLIIEQNVTNGNGSAGGAAINLASVRQSVVRNNVIYDNLAGSIACWDNNYADDKGLASSVFGCRNLTVVNNTVFEEAGNRSAVVFTNDAQNLTVFNNLIIRERADAYEISARSGKGLQSAANYYYALDIFDSPDVILIDTDAGSGSITGFTLEEAAENFVAPNSNAWLDLTGAYPQLNPTRPDFHPLADAVIADMANAAYLPDTDFTGIIRSGNAAGAYEVTGGGVTPTPSITPGGPTLTPTHTLEPTATNTPIPGTELLSNRSFELDDDGDKIPDEWTGKNLSKDKRKCNTVTKTVAYDGNCAVLVKGGSAEASKFLQKPAASALVAGDTLILSAYVDTKNLVSGATLLLKGTYADDITVFKEKLVIPTGTAGYTQLVNAPVVLADGVSKLKVQFGYRGISGKFYIDLLSLVQQNVAASGLGGRAGSGSSERLPLPPTH